MLQAAGAAGANGAFAELERSDYWGTGHKVESGLVRSRCRGRQGLDVESPRRVILRSCDFSGRQRLHLNRQVASTSLHLAAPPDCHDRWME